MHWLTILVVSMAANFDNIGIGFAYGVRKVKVPFLSNLIIAIISMAATFLSVTAGGYLVHFIKPGLANFLGSLLLCIIGAWTLLSYRISHHSSAPEQVEWDKDKNNVISWNEAFYLGIALSLNCIASGIGLGANRISALYTAVCVGVISLLTISLGESFGNRFSKSFIGKYSTVISGLMLILIGAFEMFF